MLSVPSIHVAAPAPPKAKPHASSAHRPQRSSASGPLCHFCKSNPSDAPQPHTVSLYYLLQRKEYYPLYRTRYSTLEVDIPLCKTCEARHNREGVAILVCTIIAFLVSFVFLAQFQDPTKMMSDWGLIVGLIIASCVLAVGVMYIFALPVLVIMNRDKFSISDYPPIKELEGEKWEIGDAPRTKGFKYNHDATQDEVDLNHIQVIRKARETLSRHELQYRLSEMQSGEERSNKTP